MGGGGLNPEEQLGFIVKDIYCLRFSAFLCPSRNFISLSLPPVLNGSGDGLVAKPCPTLLQPHGTVALQALLSMGFFSQEYWSGLPFPSLGDLPEPGAKPLSVALQVDSLPTEGPGKR